MMARTIVASLVLGWLCVGAVPAEPPRRQTTGRAPLADERLPLPPALRAAVGTVREEARRLDSGDWRIQNESYRATFSPHGVRFEPARSRQGYDEQRAWTFRATAIAAGADRRPLPPVEPTAAGHVVEFVRPGLVERYVADRRGVEQVFVLDERPAARVDVRISAATSVPARPDGTGGLLFRHPDGQDTRYSAPVAFDASRRAVAVRAEATEAGIDLVLDGGDLDAARFPVTVDPIISGAAGVHSADYVTWMDVAFNWRRGEFLLVFGRDEPGEDQSVHLRRFRANGQSIGGTVPVATSGGWNWRPKVAYNVHLDRYLVVWEQTSGPPDWTSTIRALQLDSLANPIGGDVALNDVAGAHGIEPDVAARNFRQALQGGDTAWLVTWREWREGEVELAVMAERIDATGTELGEQEINDNPIFYAPAPQAPTDQASEAPVAYSPHTDRFLVAWLDHPEIRGRTIGAAAGTPGTGFAISEGGVGPLLPAVEYDMGSRRFLAAWLDVGGVRGDILTADALPVELGDFPIAAVSSHPSISAEPGGFLVTSSRPMGLELDLRYSYVSPAGVASDLGTITTDSNYHDYLSAVATGQQGLSLAAWRAWNVADDDWAMRAVLFGRFYRFVHGRSGDFGGSPDSDLFVFRQGAAQWHVRTSDGVTTIAFGSPGDLPVVMDVDGDALADIGIWRPSTGRFHVRRTATAAIVTATLGRPGDIPAPGDYTRDGVDDFAVFEPTTGQWSIRDAVTAATTTIVWGERGDLPVPADYDGDGRTDLGVWRPSTGQWRMRDVLGAFATAVAFGAAGDVPLQGNFVGSARADQVVFRPQTGQWLRRDGETGVQTVVPWGMSGDMPVPLDYDDDGLLDLAVFRSTTRSWHIRDALGAWTTAINFGMAGDLPAGAP